MRARRLKNGDWSIRFEPQEADEFIQSLRALAEHYQISDDDLPDKLKRHRRGRIVAEDHDEEDDELAEAQSELEAARQAWRSERLPYIEAWLEKFSNRKGKGWSLRLAEAEVDILMAMTNDRRLSLAAEHDIDSELMEMDLSEITNTAQRDALLEIRRLEDVMRLCMVLLEYAEEEAANKSDDADDEDDNKPGDGKPSQPDQLTLDAIGLFGAGAHPLPSNVSEDQILGAINDMLRELREAEEEMTDDSLRPSDPATGEKAAAEDNATDSTSDENDNEDEYFEITEEHIAQWDAALEKHEASATYDPISDASDENEDDADDDYDDDEDNDADAFDDDDDLGSPGDNEGDDWKK